MDMSKTAQYSKLKIAMRAAPDTDINEAKQLRICALLPGTTA